MMSWYSRYDAAADLGERRWMVVVSPSCGSLVSARIDVIDKSWEHPRTSILASEIGSTFSRVCPGGITCGLAQGLVIPGDLPPSPLPLSIASFSDWVQSRARRWHRSLDPDVLQCWRQRMALYATALIPWLRRLGAVSAGHGRDDSSFGGIYSRVPVLWRAVPVHRHVVLACRLRESAIQLSSGGLLGAGSPVVQRTARRRAHNLRKAS